MNKARSKKARGNMCNWLFCLFVNVQVFVYIVLALAISQPVHAAVFNCSSGDVSCLIAAIETANANSEDDTIYLKAGTYTLSEVNNRTDRANGLPSITTNITINGVRGKTIIERSSSEGVPDFRIFHVATTGTLALKGLSVINGASEPGPDAPEGDGGAIYNLGRLTIKNSIISNNLSNDDGGGISSRGETEIINSTISNNRAHGGSGGIQNFSTMTITKSIISNNVSAITFIGGGGGITNYDKLTLIRCTIRDNHDGTSSVGGGGILNFGPLTIKNSEICGNFSNSDGGGIHHRPRTHTMEIINSTIGGNTANGSGGGIWCNHQSTANISNCTISGNSDSRLAGGIYGGFDSNVKLQNTILANNSAPRGPDCFPGFISQGHNLIGDPADCTISGGNGDIIGENPELGLFVLDERPGSGRFPLEPNSPAIDVGNNSTCVNELAFDQLGFPRVDGDDNRIIDCDIGAVEFQRPNIYRFIVMADSRDDDGTGVNEIVFPKVMDSISELSPQPTFILFVGDLVRGGRQNGSDMTREFQEWKEYVTQYYPLANVYPVFGGHERNPVSVDEYPRKWSAFQKAFDPINEGLIHSVGEYFEPEGRGNTVYYFEYQNAGFFVLNNDCNPSDEPSERDFEHEIDPDQLEWLKITKLAVNEQPLKFFFHHEPAFGTGAHGEFLFKGQDLPEEWLPYTMDRKDSARTAYIKILAEYDATMIFTGHEHQYVRRLINQALTPYDSSWGSFYEVKTGTCGAPIYGPPSGEWNMDGYHDKFMKNVVVGPVYEYHYAVVDVDGTDVSVNVYAVDENTGNRKRIDSFKHPQPIPPSLPIEPRKQPENWRFWSGKDDVWRYFKGEDAHPSNWKSINFDDSDWFVGPAGIGYGDNSNHNDDDSTVLVDMEQKGEEEGYLSVYARRTFTVDQPTDVTQLTFSIDYDDGFVAYLNGNEVARRKMERRSVANNGTPPWEEPAWNEPAEGSHEAGSSEQIVITDKIHLLVSGLNVLAIQGHNISKTSSDFSLIPSLTAMLQDTDNDGVPDSEEGSHANNIAFAQLDTATGAGSMTVEPSIGSLRGVAAIHDADPKLDQESKPYGIFPFGLTSMDITGLTEGETVTVDLTFPSDIPTDYQYVKYDKNNNLWQQFSFGSNDGDNVITLTLTDGGVGDSNVEHGVITDPGGLVLAGPMIVNYFVTFEPIGSTYRSTYDTTGCTEGFVGKFSFDARLTNTSDSSLTDLVVKVAELTNENLMQNADGGPGGVGSQLTVSMENGYSDGELGPEESIIVPFTICLKEFSSFRFFVDVLGTVR